ncbi:hypothetical protein K9L97_03480 [Candidatus Woesearchaeota archaeon]|nr:hypothetical protein [Candidatus Woesearchaeota archaeon]
MSLSIDLPLGKENSTKNLIFSILTKEYPLKLIELTNYIKRRYGKSVTFQAVRKAALELEENEVLVKEKNEFRINKQWVADAKKTVDNLYEDLNKDKSTPEGLDSIRGEVSVFTFDSPNEMIKFWYSIMKNWIGNFKKGDHDFNCYQAPHIWEALLHPDKEKETLLNFIKKGIKCYSLTTGGTPLDRYAKRFYEKMGVKTEFIKSLSDFDRTYFVATYGETIVQVYYPKKVIDKLEEFYKKNVSLEDLDVHELSEIMNIDIKTKMTVIKNLEMAKQINKSIISQIE